MFGFGRTKEIYNPDLMKLDKFVATKTKMKALSIYLGGDTVLLDVKTFTQYCVNHGISEIFEARYFNHIIFAVIQDGVLVYTEPQIMVKVEKQ